MRKPIQLLGVLAGLVAVALFAGCGAPQPVSKAPGKPAGQQSAAPKAAAPEKAPEPVSPAEKAAAGKVEVQEPPSEQPIEKAEEAGGASKAPAEAAKPETPGEAGWIALLNGKDLTGWQNAREPEGPNRWLVEEGALTNEEHANDVGTKDQWKNFELTLEYKTVAGGNSGVYLRGRIEIQILDSFGKAKVENLDNGGVYGQFAPLVNASKPAGEWNTLEATFVGDELTAKLNGQLVQDKQKISEVTGGALPGGVTDPGPLMLQGDHGKVWFRNIKIHPLLAVGGGTEPKSEAPEPKEPK